MKNRDGQHEKQSKTYKRRNGKSLRNDSPHFCDIHCGDGRPCCLLFRFGFMIKLKLM
uniref:Uncharacterized protein n=1 Tax=Octopus bimaculoides TaxID=37653 RepID=A0A0L8GPJ4_OCTBM